MPTIGHSTVLLGSAQGPCDLFWLLDRSCTALTKTPSVLLFGVRTLVIVTIGRIISHAVAIPKVHAARIAR